MRLVLISSSALLIGLFVTPLWVRWLRARGYAQSIRDSEELGYAVPDHAGKKGTPSMGGVVIVAGTVLSYIAAHIDAGSGPSASALLVLFLMVGLASVGFADDYIKIFRRRSTGLRVEDQAHRTGGRRHRLRAACPAVPRRRRPHPRHPVHLLRPGHLASSCPSSLRRVGVVHGGGDVQRREPDRRARWPGDGRGIDDLRRLRDHRAVAVQPAMLRGDPAQLLRGAESARPGGGGGRRHGVVLRLPVVERVTGPDLHG